MSGNKLFLDTNIILYFLDGDKTLAELLHNKQLYISFITELELLAFRNLNNEEENIISEFISECHVVGINDSIKSETIRIRRKYNTKLPDSIIAATSFYLDLPLITADSSFKKIKNISVLFFQ